MKSKSEGSASIAWIIIGSIILVLASAAIWVASARNDLVRFENRIEAVDKDMQNVHASIFQQMRQQGVAVEKYGDLVIQAINAAMSGRYGTGGSKAAFQWLQEQNPTIDSKIMDKLQVAIEAGYNRFEATQRTKLDIVRTYKDATQVFPKNIVAGLFGYPKKPWEEIGRIVTSAQTKADFEKGELSDPGIFAKPAPKPQ
jgi:hypothetical protein